MSSFLGFYGENLRDLLCLGSCKTYGKVLEGSVTKPSITPPAPGLLSHCSGASFGYDYTEGGPLGYECTDGGPFGYESTEGGPFGYDCTVGSGSSSSSSPG